MATTARKDRAKKVEEMVKQVEELKVVKPKVEKKTSVKKEVPSVLAPDHLLKLETLQRDIENAKLNMALQEQYLQNLLLDFKIRETAIEKQRLCLQQIAKEYEAKKSGYASYKRDVFPLYDVKEDQPLSYNPETGEIVKE